jgi:hypothetical protein
MEKGNIIFKLEDWKIKIYWLYLSKPDNLKNTN